MVLVYAGMLKVTVHPAFEVTWKSPMLMVVLPLKLCSPRLLISPEPAETFPLISTVAPLLAATTSNAFSQAGIVISIGDLLLSATLPNVYSGLPNFFVTVSAPMEYVMYTPSSLASMPLIAPLSFKAPKF